MAISHGIVSTHHYWEICFQAAVFVFELYLLCPVLFCMISVLLGYPRKVVSSFATWFQILFEVESN